MATIYRKLYLGRTRSNHTHLYLGAESAKFAQFLYNKSKIEFELYETDLRLHENDFLHLINVKATTFKDGGDFENVKHMTDIILDAFDIMKEQGFGDANLLHCNHDALLTNMNVFSGDDHVFVNKKENIGTFVAAKGLPKYNDTILTIEDWQPIAQNSPYRQS